MRPKPHPTEKRSLILEKPFAEFETFCRELSQTDRAYLLQVLPEAHGFRPNRPESIQLRLWNLWNDAKGHESARDTSRAWKILNDIWCQWITSHPVLNSILKEYDNSADFPEGEEKEGKEPNTELDIKCFEHLLDASRDGKINRETIQQFYDFGYFKKDIIIESLINQAKPEKEIQRDKFIDNFPNELKKVRDDIDHLRENIESIRNSNKNLKEELAKNHNSVSNKLIMMSNEIDEKLKSLMSRIHEIDNKNLKENINDEIKMIKEKIQYLGEDCRESNIRLMDCRKNIEEENEFIRNHIGELEKKIDKNIDDALNSISSHNLAPINESSALHVTHVSPPLQISLYNSLNDLLTALCDNFRVLGLTSGSSRILAQEVLVGLGVQQVVMFRGSLASIVANICASTIAASHQHILNVPIGLLRNRDFDHILERTIDNSVVNEHVSVMTIEGLNRSAVECYASSLQSLVARRIVAQGTTASSLILFATLVEGPSALPISRSICELGPIFDTDVLTWSDSGRKGILTPGMVPTAAWSEWLSHDNVNSQDRSLFEELIEVIDTPPSRLWKMGIKAAYDRLATLRDTSDVTTPLQSLAFGWFIPRALTVEHQSLKLQECLDEECLDTKQPDTRIQKILRFYGNVETM